MTDTALRTLPPTAHGPGRRTQHQRRTATRTALLEAAVDCLVERGYAATTIAEVQARAGVSRGALTHHFASKADLMLAAMDLLYEQLSDTVLRQVEHLPTGPQRVEPALEILWATFDGPLFLAAMELWAAARTDSTLRSALLPQERAYGRQLRQLALWVFGADLAGRPGADALYDVLLTSMRGQALTYVLNPDAPRSARPLEQWKQIVRAVAAQQSSEKGH